MANTAMVDMGHVIASLWKACCVSADTFSITAIRAVKSYLPH